jgi:hypothetical protein
MAYSKLGVIRTTRQVVFRNGFMRVHGATM